MSSARYSRCGHVSLAEAILLISIAASALHRLDYRAGLCCITLIWKRFDHDTSR